MVLGYTWIRDIGETSMFMKLNVMVIVATDDFAVAGPQGPTVWLHRLLDEKLGFSKMPNYVLSEMVGLERFNLTDHAAGRKQILLHQTAYARHVVAQFAARHNNGNPLRRVALSGTPTRETETPKGSQVPHESLRTDRYPRV